MARLIRILLVEDNPGDVELTRLTLEEAKIACDLDHAEDGVAALEHLKSTAHRPDLVLLDLNMPRMDGREPMKQMKDDPQLATIPIVVLTSSDASADVVKSYQLQASAYVKKTVALEGFAQIAQGIEGFSLTLVSYPTAP